MSENDRTTLLPDVRSSNFGLIPPEMRQQLYEEAKKRRQKETPKKHIKYKGQFAYASYSYMLDEMDKIAPIRSEIITTDYFNEKYLVYHIAVRVTNLETGESHSGVCAHAIPAFEQGSEVQKPISSLRLLMANSYKAALTEALRNAYSNFGVCGDLYDTGMSDPPTKEQNAIFWEWDKWMDENIYGKAGRENLEAWWNQIKGEWDQQDSRTADEYLKSLGEKITKVKEKYGTVTV